MAPKTTPKDFFLHLGAVIALYAAAIALINLALSAINYALPDKLANYFYAGSIIWPVSMLIVLVPLLYVLEWLIGRDIARMPEKREIWVRRWRIYLTLFLTGAVIVGDVIALLNTYLNGEITARFGYKVLAVLIAVGVIFAYYILAKSISPGAVLWRKILAWFGIILAVGTIIGGFVIVGSPAKQRAIRFDQQRVSDLTNIQYDITNYWQRTGKLPVSLSALNDPLSNIAVPVDPETGASYEYKVLNQTTPANSSMPSFELCATFDAASQNVNEHGVYNTGDISVPISYPSGMSDNWTHQSGHMCFDRVIDPSRYPPVVPVQPGSPVPAKPI